MLARRVAGRAAAAAVPSSVRLSLTCLCLAAALCAGTTPAPETFSPPQYCGMVDKDACWDAGYEDDIPTADACLNLCKSPARTCQAWSWMGAGVAQYRCHLCTTIDFGDAGEPGVVGGLATCASVTPVSETDAPPTFAPISCNAPFVMACDDVGIHHGLSGPDDCLNSCRNGMLPCQAWTWVVDDSSCHLCSSTSNQPTAAQTITGTSDCSSQTAAPTIPDTDAPPTDAPPTNAPPTSVPLTAVPTAVPDTGVPTAAPTGVPPTDAPQPPATTAAPSPAPPGAPTSAPATAVPPATSLPPTAQPTTPAPPPRLPKQEQIATTGGVASAASFLGSGGGAAATATRLVVASVGCTLSDEHGGLKTDANGDSVPRLPRALHPTQWVVHGSEAAGVVLGNMAITVGFSAVCFAMVRVAASGGRRMFPLFFEGIDTQGLLRFPSAPLFIFQLLYQGTTYGSMVLVLHAPTPMLAMVGGASVAACMVVPCALLTVVHGDVPAKARYRFDEHTKSSLLRFWIGPGEWVARTRRTSWVNRYASVVRTFRQDLAWYAFVEFTSSFTLSAIAAVEARNEAACGHVKLASAAVFLVLLFVECALWPHAKRRDGLLDVVLLGAQFCAMTVRAFAYYSLDREHWGFLLSSQLLVCCGMLLMCKVVVDVLSEVYVLVKRRRARLETAEVLELEGGGDDTDTSSFKELGAVEAGGTETPPTDCGASLSAIPATPTAQPSHSALLRHNTHGSQPLMSAVASSSVPQAQAQPASHGLLLPKHSMDSMLSDLPTYPQSPLAGAQLNRSLLVTSPHSDSGRCSAPQRRGAGPQSRKHSVFGVGQPPSPRVVVGPWQKTLSPRAGIGTPFADNSDGRHSDADDESHALLEATVTSMPLGGLPRRSTLPNKLKVLIPPPSRTEPNGLYPLLLLSPASSASRSQNLGQMPVLVSPTAHTPRSWSHSPEGELL